MSVICKNEVFVWEWCNFCTFGIDEVEVRKDTRIWSPGAFKIEAFWAHVGLPGTKNGGREGYEKNDDKKDANLGL